MTDWFDIALTVWRQGAPFLMLAALLLIMLTGYPFAFITGAVALAFAVAGAGSGLMDGTLFAALPDDILSEIILNPILLALPLIVLFAELLVASGQMVSASRAVKATFGASVYPSEPDEGTTSSVRSARRDTMMREDMARGRREPNRQRSTAMALLLPVLILMHLVAYQFAVPPDYLAMALTLPAAALIGLYLANWLVPLWGAAHKRRRLGLKQGESPASDAGRFSSARSAPDRPWGKMMVCLGLPLAFALGAVLLLVWKLSLLATFAILCLLAIGLTACQLRLSPGMLMTILNRSTLATASLYTMIIMALIFNKVFLALGGAQTIDTLLLIIRESTAPVSPLLMLLALLVGLVGFGMLFDWLIMALIILPLCMPVFAHCDFGARLAAFWPAATPEGSGAESANALISVPFSLPVRLWLAALASTALLCALVTFNRQNGEVAQKELVSWTGKIKDGPASMGLFLVLQIVGLIAIIIMPQLVLWLPSVIVE
ncbi:hypothetical protein [Cohaesibacter haloalkalitolerans]|uniref:hypothetical protein n=1 Tax=Cohaesibacter haloalkalitolerans TaxID=1162980 RepID=UPI000E654F52|nr:hypothetical protein [Cohaesibacter haloalkalitolerans]